MKIALYWICLQVHICSSTWVMKSRADNLVYCYCKKSSNISRPQAVSVTNNDQCFTVGPKWVIWVHATCSQTWGVVISKTGAKKQDQDGVRGSLIQENQHFIMLFIDICTLWCQQVQKHANVLKDVTQWTGSNLNMLLCALSIRC